MRKRIISIMLALLLLLTLSLVTTTPVTANGGDEVFIIVSGEVTHVYNGVEYTAKVIVIIDSTGDRVTFIARYGKPVYNPYVEQWTIGINGEAELESWDIDGSTIELGVGPMPLYLLPSGDLWGVEPNAAEIDITGTISGITVTLDFGPSFSDMTGIIIIK